MCCWIGRQRCSRSRERLRRAQWRLPIQIASPDQPTWGCLHPDDARLSAFDDGPCRYYSVSGYLLLQRLALPEDVEKLRCTYELAAARKLAQGKPRRPENTQLDIAALRHAYAHSFDQNLNRRALLLATGSEPIEVRLGDDARLGIGADGRGENRLGKLLMELREGLAARAADPDAVQCGHDDPELEIRGVCVHHLDQRGIHRRHFTGVGLEYELLCDACVAALPQQPPRRKVCENCFRELQKTDRRADCGTPAIKLRASPLRFVHRAMAGPANVVAFAPVPRVAHAWLMLDAEGVLHRVDVAQGHSEIVGRLQAATLDLGDGAVLTVAPDGELAAIGEARGRNGVVLDLASGEIVQRLQRDDYHTEHCTYPLGLFELDGRLLLVHATQWNRLDVADARTGELLTARESCEEHALDYFHSDVLLSPDGKRILDNGWVWHPCGNIRTFSLERWVKLNPWESEDGPSVHSFGFRPYFWDGPVAWLDDRTIAIWGGDADEVELMPVVVLYDVETGKTEGSFAGPAAAILPLAPYLVSSDDQGTAVWDPKTGERLLHDASFDAAAAHPTSCELLSKAEGGFRVSTLEGET